MMVLGLLQRYRVVFILSASILAALIFVPGFGSVVTAALALDRAASTGLLAVGLTVLLITGQIDLSGGAIFALAGIVAIVLQPYVGIYPAAVLGLVSGLAAGAINGFLVVVLRINSLVATLATMLAFRAIAHWITESQPTSGIDIMFALWVSQTFGAIFTFRSALFLVAIIALHIWLTRAIVGRNLFAVGSSTEAATASGLNASRIRFGAFCFGGLLAGLAGVLQSLSLNTGSPIFGSDLTILAITAVVVGGTRIEGGRGSALGTLGGVLTVAVLTTAMEFNSISAYIQQIVTGSILLLLVALDRTIKNPGRKVGAGSKEPFRHTASQEEEAI